MAVKFPLSVVSNLFVSSDFAESSQHNRLTGSIKNWKKPGFLNTNFISSSWSRNEILTMPRNNLGR